MDMIDLRSDTLTRPSREVTQAMAEADMGDDCYGESRDVIQLEEYCADLFGKESGIFMPSGTMSNQVALRCLVERGQEVVCDASYHINFFEASPTGDLAGVTLNAVATADGLLTPEVLDEAESSRARWSATYAGVGLVWTENTINGRGAKVYPLAALAETHDWSASRHVPLYLDGARVFNAMAATGTTPREWGEQVEALSFCFAKGLGAPAGSVLVGDADALSQARSFRKWYGGALHQSGPLAAAALWALTHNVERLAQDHASALRFAEELREWGVDAAIPDTNMVLLDVGEYTNDPDTLIAVLASRGVLMLVWTGTLIRAVFCLNNSESDAVRAARVVGETLVNWHDNAMQPA